MKSLLQLIVLLLSLRLARFYLLLLLQFTFTVILDDFLLINLFCLSLAHLILFNTLNYLCWLFLENSLNLLQELLWKILLFFYAAISLVGLFLGAYFPCPLEQFPPNVKEMDKIEK